jgi:hypothetical protein
MLVYSTTLKFGKVFTSIFVGTAALPDFLSSSGSGTGSTQPREPREVN